MCLGQVYPDNLPAVKHNLITALKYIKFTVLGISHALYTREWEIAGAILEFRLPTQEIPPSLPDPITTLIFKSVSTHV